MDDRDILQLYLNFKDDWKGWLDLHHKHFAQFVALILAVLAATLAATYRFLNNPGLLLSIAIGPFINVGLSVIGIKLCNRFYQRFLEHEAISNNFFRLFRKVSEEQGKKPLAFPESDKLFPKRWLHAQKESNSIETFVRSQKYRGSNRWIVVSFIVLLLLNILVIAFIVWRWATL